MAAANPAVIPLPNAIPNLEVAERFRLVSSDIDLNTSSWQNSLTVNWPIAYGICLCTGGEYTDVDAIFTYLHRMGTNPA
jgi:hypothetical protein